MNGMKMRSGTCIETINCIDKRTEMLYNTLQLNKEYKKTASKEAIFLISD